MSASDRRHLAFPGVCPRPDCSGRSQDRPREMVFVVRHVFEVKTSNPPQARSGVAPVIQPEAESTPPISAALDAIPARWLAWPVVPFGETGCQRSHDGLRLLAGPAARYSRSQKAFLPPGPIRSRSIRQREQGNHRMGLEGGDEIVVDLCGMLPRAPSPHWWGRMKFQRLGFSQVLEISREGVGFRARKFPLT